MAQDQTHQQTDDQNSRSKAPRKILEYKDEAISDETQQMLNQPLSSPQGLEPQDRSFLELLVNKIEKGEINLYRPSSLLNMPVYEKLSEESQGKADFNALNLLGAIRDIHRLWNQGHNETYQLQNLVHRFRVTKERLEALAGDIFII